MNETIDILIRTYPGDDAWHRYVAACGITTGTDPITDIKGILAFHGADPDRWLHARPGVLGGNTAAEILATGTTGLKAVRHALMRWP